MLPLTQAAAARGASSLRREQGPHPNLIEKGLDCSKGMQWSLLHECFEITRSNRAV